MTSEDGGGGEGGSEDTVHRSLLVTMKQPPMKTVKGEKITRRRKFTSTFNKEFVVFLMLEISKETLSDTVYSVF